MNLSQVRLLFAAALVCAACVPAWAGRGRPIIVEVPEGAGRAAFVKSWNGGLGMEFDLVMNAADAADPFAAFDGVAAGEAAWRVTDLEGVALREPFTPDIVSWLFLDFAEAAPERDIAAEVVEAGAIAAPRQWKVAVLPPVDRAAELGPIIAPSINAYIIPLSGPSEGLIEAFQPIADSVAKANGRCRVGVYLSDSDLSTPEGIAAWLPFYDATDDIVHFYAGRFPEDGAALAAAIGTLNTDLEGPQASEGMHADRFRAPDVPLDPITERRVRTALSALSILVLAGIPAVVYFARRPKRV